MPARPIQSLSRHKAESEPEQASAINGTAPRVLAEEARRLGAILVPWDEALDGAMAEL